VPADLARIPQPRLGFFGTLRDSSTTTDRRHGAGEADVHIVLIGQKHVDLAELEALPNVTSSARRSTTSSRVLQGLRRRLDPYRIDDNVSSSTRSSSASTSRRASP